MTEIEKIEFSKNNNSYFLTGELITLEDGWVEVRTTRGEKVRLRKEQIVQRNVQGPTTAQTELTS